MKFYFCLIFLTIFVANSTAWLARGIYYNPDNPGKCTFNEQLIISPGDTVQHPDQCAKINCNDEEGNVLITGCGVRAAPPGCKWGEPINAKAPFPKCCDKHLICEDPSVQISWENQHNSALNQMLIGDAVPKTF